MVHTVQAEHGGKVGQPFCRLGSCIASSYPPTLERQFSVCVGVYVLSGGLKGEGASGPWE